MRTRARTYAAFLAAVGLAGGGLALHLAVEGPGSPPAPTPESGAATRARELLEVHVRLAPGVTRIWLEDEDRRPVAPAEDLRFEVWNDGSTGHPAQVSPLVALGGEPGGWRVETVPRAPLAWLTLAVPRRAEPLRLRLEPAGAGVAMFWVRGIDVVLDVNAWPGAAGSREVLVPFPRPMS